MFFYRELLLIPLLKHIVFGLQGGMVAEFGKGQILGIFGLYGLKFSWLMLGTKTLDHFGSLVWSKIFVRLAKF